jgi:hypothetical protein
MTGTPLYFGTHRSILVRAGAGPGHPRPSYSVNKNVHARVKPGHDEGEKEDDALPYPTAPTSNNSPS